MCRDGSRIGLPDMLPLSLAKAMIEPVKVTAPMATPSAHLDQRLRVDLADRADAEGLRRIERRRGDQHRGKADQRMEGRDELRHRRHRDSARDDRADRAAERPSRRSGASQPTKPAGGAPNSVVSTASAMPTMPKRLPLPARLRMRQPAQRQDEEHAGDEIEEGGEAGAHCVSSSSARRSDCNQRREVARRTVSHNDIGVDIRR